MRRLATGLLALAPLLISAGQAQAQIVFNTFATPNIAQGSAPIGFTYAGNKFVGSLYNTNTGRIVLYSTDLNGGNIQQFGGAVSDTSAPADEHYVSASLGLGGFPKGDIYVARGNSVVHYNNAGTTEDNFATGLSGAVRGILFDNLGTFGYKMLVSTDAGNVYSIDSTGSKSLLANIPGVNIEGMAIAPGNGHFGPFNGDLIVGQDNGGDVYAIKPSGTIDNGGARLFSNGSNAEELSFVPMNLGASGNPLEGLYASNYDHNVLKADASDFATLKGDLIVTNESPTNPNNVIDYKWNGSGFTPTVVGVFPPLSATSTGGRSFCHGRYPSAIRGGARAVGDGAGLHRSDRGARVWLAA